jgi:hypothetical protein
LFEQSKEDEMSAGKIRIIDTKLYTRSLRWEHLGTYVHTGREHKIILKETGYEGVGAYFIYVAQDRTRSGLL